MKSAVACLAVVAGASAFTPSAPAAKTTSLKALDYDSLSGTTIETGNKFWDPMNLSEWIPAEYARKAELSNGRSAMLATVGWIFPQKVGMFAGDDVTTSDPIDAFLQADPQWWAQFIIFCGTIEAIKYRAELEGKSYMGFGEPAIDWTGHWATLDDAGKEKMALRELKHGRLAMIGVASFFSAHFWPGTVPALPADFV